MVRKEASKMSRIEPGTPEMAERLSVGYGMTLEEAKLIIKEREANPQTHPYERLVKAQAFLQAYTATPQVISTRPGWKRSRGG